MFTMTGRAGAILLLAVLLGNPAARSATLDVGQGEGFAFSTIQDAIDASATGDTILVAPGIYTETRDFTPGCCLTRPTVAAVTVDSLTILGADRDSVMVKGAELGDPHVDGWGIAMQEGLSYLSLESVTVQGWSQALLPVGGARLSEVTVQSASAGVFALDADVLAISACRFERIGTAIATKQNGETSVLVKDSLFRDVTTGVTTLGTTGTVRIAGTRFEGGVVGVIAAVESFVEVESCVFGPDQYAGVSFMAGSRGYVRGSVFECDAGGILLDEVQDVTVVNNRIRSGSTSGISLFSSCGNTIRDNILELAGETMIFASDYDHDGLCSTVDLRHNYWHEMTNSEIHRAIHDANDDPVIGATVEFWPRLIERPVANEATTFGGLKRRYR